MDRNGSISSGKLRDRCRLLQGCHRFPLDDLYESYVIECTNPTHCNYK